MFVASRSLRPFATAFAAALALALGGGGGACSRSGAVDANTDQGALQAAAPPPTPSPIPPSRPLIAAPPALSPELPFDLAATPSADPQADLDDLSWRTFVALNWPVFSDGKPDRSQVLGQNGDNSTLWGAWREVSQIFLPDAAPPAPWGAPPSPAARPEALRHLPPGSRILTQISKSSDPLLAAPDHAFPAVPLIDQNGRYVRFEVMVNRPLFDAVVSQRLYDREAQASAGSVDFPAGALAGRAPGPGSIIVMAAWKILSPAEIAAGRFHAVPAVIYTPPSANPPWPETVEPAIVGLVGLHIVHKTASSPLWIWATFEHVDNCPDEGEAAYRAAYNFYDKANPATPAKAPPAPPWNPAAIEPPGRRSQIVRRTPIAPGTRALNEAYQAAFRAINPASVWQYYKLIGTQRPLPDSAPTPRSLENTTIETYLRDRSPDNASASSCVDCHRQAGTANGDFADFTFLLKRAR